MRGLPIIVFATLFAYIACALPSISRRTPLPARGALGPLRPRGPLRNLFSGKGKDANQETNVVPQAGEGESTDPGSPSPSCKGKQKVEDGVCCDYPNSVQYQWEKNRGKQISREYTMNQVYRLKSDFKEQPAVIKAIPVISDEIHTYVENLVQNLRLVNQFLGFAIQENKRRFAINIDHMIPTLEQKIPAKNKKPYKTYFIAMSYMGVAERFLDKTTAQKVKHIQKLKMDAIAYYREEYGMYIPNIRGEDFVFEVKKNPETHKLEVVKAEIIGLDRAILLEKAIQKKASLTRIEPEKFCLHDQLPPVEPRALHKDQ